jgi:hypothetical protein
MKEDEEKESTKEKGLEKGERGKVQGRSAR